MSLSGEVLSAHPKLILWESVQLEGLAFYHSGVKVSLVEKS